MPLKFLERESRKVKLLTTRAHLLYDSSFNYFLSKITSLLFSPRVQMDHDLPCYRSSFGLNSKYEKETTFDPQVLTPGPINYKEGPESYFAKT